MLKSFYKKDVIEVGCDEAGRGCLAGPVCAAAVIFPPDFNNPSINDSKKISAKKRADLKILIEEQALSYAVSMLDAKIIDEINILNASIKAMQNAIGKLKIKPQHIIVDGNRFKAYKKIPHSCIIKGDAKYYSIAAASILAKTYRDEYMIKLAEKYPVYNWSKNKGYPTKEHKRAIEKYGITKYHRRSFKLIDKQLNLF